MPATVAPSRRRPRLARGTRPLVPLVALCLLAALATEAAAQRGASDDLAVLHDRCVAFAQAHPEEGLERAKEWREQGGGFYADHCVAMALFQLHQFAEAAQRFEQLATATLGMPPRQRAQALDQAGQAWLSAQEPARAKSAFDAAIELNGDDADLRIDRAEAFADLQRYWDAIDDLNRASDLDPNRADTYFYRGSAYRHVDSRELALEDIEHGLSLAPNSTMGLLERGILRRLAGDIAGARQDWKRVSELAPNSAAAKAAEINLANLKGKGPGDKPALGPAPKMP
jgi:tetratricopeptide (TPR) repeat protein